MCLFLIFVSPLEILPHIGRDRKPQLRLGEVVLNFDQVVAHRVLGERRGACQSALCKERRLELAFTRYCFTSQL